MTDTVGNKWTPGTSCGFLYLPGLFIIRNLRIDGPVLSQTDLYLLKPELEIHPILANQHTSQHTFHLSFNLVTGKVLSCYPPL